MYTVLELRKVERKSDTRCITYKTHCKTCEIICSSCQKYIVALKSGVEKVLQNVDQIRQLSVLLPSEASLLRIPDCKGKWSIQFVTFATDRFYGFTKRSVSIIRLSLLFKIVYDGLLGFQIVVLGLWKEPSIWKLPLFVIPDVSFFSHFLNSWLPSDPGWYT